MVRGRDPREAEAGLDGMEQSPRKATETGEAPAVGHREPSDNVPNPEHRHEPHCHGQCLRHSTSPNPRGHSTRRGVWEGLGSGGCSPVNGIRVLSPKRPTQGTA